jgi:RNA polymerase primary sigma factor
MIESANQTERQERESGRLLWLYLKEISRIPLLTVEEEQCLAVRARKGDQEAILQLVQANLRFVIKIAKRYQNAGLPLMDLIGEGNIGLIEAARRFDPDRKVRFATYAVWWIRQAILYAMSRFSRPFRISPKAANILNRVSAATSYPKQETDEIDPERLACEIGVSLEELNVALEASGTSLSFDAPMDEKGEIRLSDVIEQKVIPSAETTVMHASTRELLRESVHRLNPREREVILLRFGLNNDAPLTLNEVGKRLGFSRERIRQIEVQALQKLRRHSTISTLVNYLN